MLHMHGRIWVCLVSILIWCPWSYASRLKFLASKCTPCKPPQPLGYWEARLEVKGTRFVARLAPCESLQDATEFRRRVSDPKATHNCWVAFDKDGRSLGHSDDGEPKGTAAMPMRRVLESAGLQGVVVVATKYFGGFLSGRGGLVREYTAACKAVIDAAEFQEVVPGVSMAVSCVPARGVSSLYNLLAHGTKFLSDISFDNSGLASVEIWTPADSKAAVLEKLLSLGDVKVEITEDED